MNTTFFELLKSRHSIRKYLPKAIEEDKLEIILKSALMSPASKCSNPWEFIVVRSIDSLKKLSVSRPTGAGFISESPLCIVVTADTTKSNVWIEDASIAATIIQLQAHALQLGSCWVQVRGRDKDETTTTEEYVRELLNIPSKYAVVCFITIGYPDEIKPSFDTELLDKTKIHTETF